MSNVLTFPTGGRSPKNVRELRNPSLISGGGTARWRSPGYKSSGRPNMHTFVFRSYELIMASSEAELVRDIHLDVDKARSKLKAIQQQLQRDREHATAREKLLASAESRLSAAIVAAGSAPRAPASLFEPPRRTKSEALEHRRAFKAAMRQRIRELAGARNLPDDEIKSVLRLKHQEIGEFAIKHSVSLAWLLEGVEPVFKKHPE
jgi:hypothetical protein